MDDITNMMRSASAFADGMRSKADVVELNPGYFDTACKRVADAYRQPDLFIAPPDPQPAQEGFDI